MVRNLSSRIQCVYLPFRKVVYWIPLPTISYRIKVPGIKIIDQYIVPRQFPIHLIASQVKVQAKSSKALVGTDKKICIQFPESPVILNVFAVHKSRGSGRLSLTPRRQVVLLFTGIKILTYP